MNFKELKCRVKQEQKDIAKNIRLGKQLRKPANFDLSTLENKKELANNCSFNSYYFRHRHIAYCMFFNKTPYENIERTCREKPDSNQLNHLKSLWESELDETIRSDT